MKLEEIYLPNRIHTLEDLESIQPIKGEIWLNPKEFRTFMKFIKPSPKLKLSNPSPELKRTLFLSYKKMLANWRRWFREGKGIYYRGIPVIRREL